MIVSNLLRNVEVSRRAVRSVLQRLPDRRHCPCSSALKDALITSIELVPEATKERLAPIIGKYVSEKVTS